MIISVDECHELSEKEVEGDSGAHVAIFGKRTVLDALQSAINDCRTCNLFGISLSTESCLTSLIYPRINPRSGREGGPHERQPAFVELPFDR